MRYKPSRRKKTIKKKRDEETECKHYIIQRLLEEFHISQAAMADELKQFPTFGHRTIWRMKYLEIVRRVDRSNSYDKREYHWFLNLGNRELTNPDSDWYFEDTAKEIEAKLEDSRIYHAQLKLKNSQKDSNKQTS